MGLFGFGFGEPHTRAAAVGGQELESFGKHKRTKLLIWWLVRVWATNQLALKTAYFWQQGSRDLFFWNFVGSIAV